MPIRTSALSMFIDSKMAPGLYPADACQECPPELPRLSSTEDKQTFASDHTDSMETTASSSNREDGAVGQEQRTCNGNPRHQARHHHRGLRPYYPYRHGLLAVDDLNTMLSRAMQSLLWPGMKQDAATTEGYVITFILFPTWPRLMVTGGGRASTVPAWLPGYLRGNPARKGLVEFTSQARIMLFVSLSLH